MTICRRFKLKNFTYFQDLASAFCNIIKALSEKDHVKRINLVFDSDTSRIIYFDKSIKASERSRRYGKKSIDLARNLKSIRKNLRISNQEDSFWASKNNKTLLHNILREYVLRNCQDIWPNVEVVCSTTGDNYPISTSPSITIDSIFKFKLFCVHLEEADDKIVQHAFHAVKQGFKRFRVVSFDTDVFVLLLTYFETFKANGLQVIISHLLNPFHERIIFY